jgi:hypothetical protein
MQDWRDAVPRKRNLRAERYALRGDLLGWYDPVRRHVVRYERDCVSVPWFCAIPLPKSSKLRGQSRSVQRHVSEWILQVLVPRLLHHQRGCVPVQDWPEALPN